MTSNWPERGFSSLSAPGLAPASLDGLLSVRGVVDVAESVDSEETMTAVFAAVLASLDAALDDLLAMRAREGDWCHEARVVEPTARVAAIDAIVGRRDERALYAFLATAPGPAQCTHASGFVRLVTDTLGSRGKTERLVCRGDGELRLMRLLDRETRDGNRAFLDAERGSLVEIEPLPANDRVGPEVQVAVRTS